MSKLAEYRQLEKHLAKQLQALEKMKGDDKSSSRRNCASCLSTIASARSTSSTCWTHRHRPEVRSLTKPRVLKVYKNPNTGEVIETEGGNHRGLKEWKAEHGADVVEGWLKK